MARQTEMPDLQGVAQAPLQRRYLTEPHLGAGNQGWDNENSDLIIAVDDIFVSGDMRRYVVKDLLGQGTFGQVVKCICEQTGEQVAVKVIKNQTAFYHQARVEVGVLQYLNKRADADDKHHIVRMRDFFQFRSHLCLVFELMSVNLYELIKHNRFKGLSLTLLRVFIAQILDALTVLREANIIHCDLKPENVLLKSLDSGEVKVIDFGSACFENKTTYSYIQSRFYRSPEVLMGHPYNVAIDMWSLGCMAAELFLGLPLFPGASEHDLLVRVVEMLGPLPESMLSKAAHTAKYFRKVEEPAGGGGGGSFRKVHRYQLRSQAEFEALHGQPAPAGKRYFQHTKLADIIGAYPYKAGLSDEEMAKESVRREAFLDFLMGVLDLDPHTRWSPKQALQHPFITNQPFRGPFQPSPDPHLPIRTPSFQPGSAPAGSPLGLAASPLSPEAHAQAHAAAMAAVSAHFSPRAAQHFGATALRRTSTDLTPPMAGSLHSSAYSANNRRASHLPPSAPFDMASNSGREAQQWAQLSPQYSGQLSGSYMGPGSFMHPSSLAAVLSPWQQQGGLPPQAPPVGSLEAMRATWRAPHNSYSQGSGFGMARSAGRPVGGNLGNAASSQDGVPRPMTINSWQDNPGSLSASLAGLQTLSQQDFGPMMGTPGSGASLARSVGFPPLSPQHPNLQKGSQSRRESLDFSSGLPPISAGREWGGNPLMTQQMGGAPRQQHGAAGGGRAKGVWLGSQEPSAQQQRLLRMASGECEPIPEPSDWDPLYSDDQLLSEEQTGRSGDAPSLADYSDLGPAHRGQDLKGLPSNEAGLSHGQHGATLAGNWQPVATAFEGFRPNPQAGQDASLGAQLDYRGMAPNSSVANAGLLSRQMSGATGGLVDGPWSWQQTYGPSQIPSLLPQPGPPQYPDSKLGLPTRQPVPRTGLRPQQGP